VSSTEPIDLQLPRRAPANLRAAWWAQRALRRTRRELEGGGIERVPALSPPPSLPPAAIRGVLTVLHRRRASCLERSVVLQRWHAAHGQPLDLVIGVSPGPDRFGAHAWLEGEHPPHGQAEGDFQEIHRLPVSDRIAPRAGRRGAAPRHP
jgi:hypothetical protein